MKMLLKLSGTIACALTVMTACVTVPEYPLVEGSNSCSEFAPGTDMEFIGAEGSVNQETGNIWLIKCWYVDPDDSRTNFLVEGGSFKAVYPELWEQFEEDKLACSESNQACAWRKS